MACKQCKSSKEFAHLCKRCWLCFDCVELCVDNRCIDCYEEDPIIQMKAIWERRRKPHIEYLMSTKNGHYMALESVCHSCEHAYKVIKKSMTGDDVTSNVMQHALEAMLRVHDFTNAALHGDNYVVNEKPHWGRKLAREIRVLLLDPLKHSGMLPNWITFTNNPNHVSTRSVFGHSRNITPEVEFDPDEWELGMTEDGRPYWYKKREEPIQWSDPEVEISYGAKSLVRQLILGLDSTYRIFTDPNATEQQKEWFSPAKYGQFRGEVDKQQELIVEEMKAL